jgi:hypothetical protein
MKILAGAMVILCIGVWLVFYLVSLTPIMHWTFFPIIITGVCAIMFSIISWVEYNDKR